jgi:hypothetical protein
LTGAGGTEGAETVVTVEIPPDDSGALVRLTHAGFPDEAALQRHDKAWAEVLRHQRITHRPLHPSIDTEHLREKRHANGHAVVRLPEDGQAGIRIEIDAQIESAGPVIARQWMHDNRDLGRHLKRAR